MNKYWTTKEGKQIPYAEIENSHLIHILEFVKKCATKGIFIEETIFSDGYDGDGFVPSFAKYRYKIKGNDVLHILDYTGLLAEAHKRNLSYE